MSRAIRMTPWALALALGIATQTASIAEAASADAKPNLAACAAQTLAQELVAPFHPQEVLERHGIDTTKLRFRTSGNEPVSWRIDALYDNEDVGFVTFETDPEFPERIFISLIKLDDKMQGTGLGKLMYLGSAKLAFDRWQLVLDRSVLVSDQAKAVWERLILDGYAERFKPMPMISDDESVRFKETVLEGPTLEETLKFFSDHGLSP